MLRIPDSVHHELLNWSRWCWTGEWPHPLPRTVCGSLESGYRSPPDWNPDDPPQPTPIQPNAINAKRVQAIYDGLGELGRKVLKAEYPCHREHAGRQGAAFMIGISVSTYEHELRIATNKIEAEFAVRP